MCLHLSACIRIILIQGDKTKELKNSKYQISDAINSSILSLWQVGRQTDMQTKKVRVIYLFFILTFIMHFIYFHVFIFFMF